MNQCGAGRAGDPEGADLSSAEETRLNTIRVLCFYVCASNFLSALPGGTIAKQLLPSNTIPSGQPVLAPVRLLATGLGSTWFVWIFKYFLLASYIDIFCPLHLICSVSHYNKALNLQFCIIKLFNPTRQTQTSNVLSSTCTFDFSSDVLSSLYAFYPEVNLAEINGTSYYWSKYVNNYTWPMRTLAYIVVDSAVAFQQSFKAAAKVFLLGACLFSSCKPEFPLEILLPSNVQLHDCSG